MKIIDAIRENFAAMEAAGLSVSEDELCYTDVLQFGPMEIISRESRKGKKGRIYTLFHTAHGDIAFIPWPDPMLFPYRRGVAQRGRKGG